MTILNDNQIQFLDHICKGRWSINHDTGLIDVSGNISIPHDYLKTGILPVKFGKIRGDFDCGWGNLKTLEGCPYHVNLDFICSNSYITTLKYAPKWVGGDVIVPFNPFQELNWIPEHIGIDFAFNFDKIDERHYGIIISDIELLIGNGVSIYRIEDKYHPFRDAYYESKLIESL